MPNLSHDNKYWFRSTHSEWIFFPFGLHYDGYIVPHRYRDRITRWTYWHAQIPAFAVILVAAPAPVAHGSLVADDGPAAWLTPAAMAGVSLA